MHGAHDRLLPLGGCFEHPSDGQAAADGCGGGGEVRYPPVRAPLTLVYVKVSQTWSAYRTLHPRLCLAYASLMTRCIPAASSLNSRYMHANSCS